MHDVNLPAALKHGIRNPQTEYGIKYQISLKNFTLHNLVQSKENLFYTVVSLAVPLNIFLLLCLDKVCHSVGYCSARPMKVILLLILIQESMGWIIQLNIAFVAKCQK